MVEDRARRHVRAAGRHAPAPTGDDRVDVRFALGARTARRGRGLRAVKCLRAGARAACATVEVTRRGRRRAASTSRASASPRSTGMIWDDKNANGRREAGEDGVAGLRVFLDDDGNGKPDPGEPDVAQDATSTGKLHPADPDALPGGGRQPAAARARARGGRRTAPAPADCVRHGPARPRPRQRHGRRPRRRAAGRDLRPRLRRLADLLPGASTCGSTPVASVRT